jgi:hypothetical protein
MNWKNRYWIVLLSIIVLSGCRNRQVIIWKSDPAMQSVSNEYFDAQIIPQDTYMGALGDGFNAFLLNITNKTDKNIELNWSKTLYMHHEQTAGGFMIEGILYKDRNDYWKVPDILFPGIVFSKVILPSVLVDRTLNGPMQPGANGIYLSVIVDGKEFNEKLSIMLSSSDVTPPSPLSKVIGYITK